MPTVSRPAERGSEAVTELVHLPVAVASPRDRGVAVSSKRKEPIVAQRLFVVERVLGHGWAVSCDRASVPTAEGAVLARGGAARLDGEPTVLPARLSVEECRRPMEILASRAALAFGRGRVADAAELEPPRAACYPFLLRYRRRRSGAIDFDVLDAVTGRRAGGSLRAAIAAALIDADRALPTP
jgi:hypothetical protein